MILIFQEKAGIVRVLDAMEDYLCCDTESSEISRH